MPVKYIYIVIYYSVFSMNMPLRQFTALYGIGLVKSQYNPSHSCCIKLNAYSLQIRKLNVINQQEGVQQNCVPVTLACHKSMLTGPLGPSGSTSKESTVLACDH